MKVNNIFLAGLNPENYTNPEKTKKENKETALKTKAFLETIDDPSEADLDFSEIDQDYLNLLDIVTEYEGGRAGKWDAVYGSKTGYPGLSKMTIGEVLEFQDKMLEEQKAKGLSGDELSTAVGESQFIKKVLLEEMKRAGLSENDLFSPKNQRKMMASRISQYRGGDKWLNGKMTTEDFIKNLSQEFASLPKDSTGVSYYDRVGRNKAHINYDDLFSKLENVKKQRELRISLENQEKELQRKALEKDSRDVDYKKNLRDNYLVNTYSDNFDLETQNIKPLY